MSADLTLPSDRAAQVARATSSQAAAIEQARAVAEVQAAVTVAQAVPRDVNRAFAEMRESCGTFAMARHAFYSVPNRGNGPSVALARELARVWGNIDYGVRELRRDDEAGESEIAVFAWDQQTNVRSTRSFIVPHARMKKARERGGQPSREKLVDLGDIYLNNQNIGARAVRECIFTVLPRAFTEEAQDLCRKTLENGEGKPLPQRIEEMVAAFRAIGVRQERLEDKRGRKRGQWTAGDVTELGIVYTTLTRDGGRVEDEFPARHVTADDITGAQQATPGTPSDVEDWAGHTDRPTVRQPGSGTPA